MTTGCLTYLLGVPVAIFVFIDLYSRIHHFDFYMNDKTVELQFIVIDSILLTLVLGLFLLRLLFLRSKGLRKARESEVNAVGLRERVEIYLQDIESTKAGKGCLISTSLRDESSQDFYKLYNLVLDSNFNLESDAMVTHKVHALKATFTGGSYTYEWNTGYEVRTTFNRDSSGLIHSAESQVKDTSRTHNARWGVVHVQVQGGESFSIRTNNEWQAQQLAAEINEARAKCSESERAARRQQEFIARGDCTRLVTAKGDTYTKIRDSLEKLDPEAFELIAVPEVQQFLNFESH
jgi:hypothetical protein